VAYAISALVAAIGENRLMPDPDCGALAINGQTGYSRENQSWVLGRLVRDLPSWAHPAVRAAAEAAIDAKWAALTAAAQRQHRPAPPRPARAGLCVAVYRARPASPDMARMVDAELYSVAIAAAVLQLGLAAVPCGLYGDWSGLMITGAGIVLSVVTASLPQWRHEKWECRHLDEHSAGKTVVLTRGNGSQHALVILGAEGFLDLEDLAAGSATISSPASLSVRLTITALAILWTALLVSASGLKDNSEFLLAIGTIGILQNVYVAGRARKPSTFGLPIEFVQVLGKVKTMQTLYEVEEAYPKLGRSLLATFFPGELRDEELETWNQYKETENARIAQLQHEQDAKQDLESS
jgi:hypothetical protein